MQNPYKKEKGQAIVLIAIAMVALIAFTGLAIDGGRVYADRRHAQNASDAGSLAGGGAAALTLENEGIVHESFFCNTYSVDLAMSEAEDAAILQMKENGYTDDEFDVIPICYPDPDNGEDPNSYSRYIDVTTIITKETGLTFIEIVYDGPFINLVDATTRVYPDAAYALGNAIVALNPDDSCGNANAGGIKFSGTGNVEITGGSGHSDGCLVAQGNCNVTILPQEEGDVVKPIGYHGGLKGLCPVMEPTPVPAELLPPDSYIIPEPSCTDNPTKTITLDSIAIHGKQEVYIPGDYQDPEDEKATLLCLTGTGDVLKMTGGKLVVDHVTIYLEGGGDINITGGAVDMTAPLKEGAASPGKGGVLIYAPYDDDPDNNPESKIYLEGNPESYYTGLIYGPGSDIKITGVGDIIPTINTQVIGWNVTLLGTANFRINFDGSSVATFPSHLDLQE